MKVVSLVEIKPGFVVSKIKKGEKDYSVIGFVGQGKAKKPQKAIVSKAKIKENLTVFRELEGDLELGSKLGFDRISVGDKLVVTAKTRSKGFQGPIKRYGFSRGPESHGSNHHRAHGSIGTAKPGRVVKGKKMAGRMGGETRSLRMTVIGKDDEDNTLGLLGSLPGPKKAFLILKSHSEKKDLKDQR